MNLKKLKPIGKDFLNYLRTLKVPAVRSELLVRIKTVVAVSIIIATLAGLWVLTLVGLSTLLDGWDVL